MQMKLAEYTARFPDRRKPVPAEFAGQWIAWNDDYSEIVAQGGDMEDVRRQALSRGHSRPVLQKIPRGPFVGGA
jgi:hypothetical protein